MKTMLEAMRKAGLVSSEIKGTGGDRDSKHDKWKRNAKTNRFGDIATFEIWRQAGKLPENYLRRCALCGKQLFDSIGWVSSKGKCYKICGECFSAEKANDKENSTIKRPHNL